MASEKQLIANRKNGLLGGVKSMEGKEKSRFNSTKHGLTSSTLLTKLKSSKEEASTYEEIFNGFKESLNPVGFLEESLIEIMAQAYFKLARCEKLEASAFTDESCLDFSSLQLGAVENRLDLSMRYKRSVEGQYYRAFAAFESLSQRRKLGSFGND